MKIEKNEYYSIRDHNILDVWGSGTTEEEAIADYKSELQKYKDKLITKFKYIEGIEKEIENLK